MVAPWRGIFSMHGMVTVSPLTRRVPQLATLRHVQEEAARSLSDMARDDSFDGKRLHEMAIEVRNADGPVLKVRFIDRRHQL